MTSEQGIEDLIRQWEETPHLLNERLGEVRNQFQDAIMVHFSARLVETHGQITPEIEATADRLYDLPGTAIVLASALRLDTPADLRRLLGRSRHISCRKCGAPLTVFEPRKKGGYSVVHPTSYKALCRTCRREERDDFSERMSTEALVRATKVQIDAQLQIIDEPLSLPHFVQHLDSYDAAWRDGRVEQFTWFTSFPIGGGCMICGAKPVIWWLISDLSLIRDSSITKTALYLLEAQAEREPDDVIWPELTNMAQILWRLDPQGYFSVMPHYPIRNLPLLPLCAECGERNDIECTHQAALVNEEVTR